MIRRNAVSIFTGAVVLQLLHFGEHLVQVLQRVLMHDPNAHGVLGHLFDLEWVHLVFNTGLALLLVLVLSGLHGVVRYRLAFGSLMGAAVFQIGIHVPEHVVRMYQYLVHGWYPAPGILGRTGEHGTGPFDLLYLHFAYNAVVTLLIVLSYLAYYATNRTTNAATA